VHLCSPGAASSEFAQQAKSKSLHVLLDLLKMAIYVQKMDISVTEFKHRCLEVIRRVEKTGQPIAITRRGKVVARLAPSSSPAIAPRKPWEALRELGGRLLADPGESALKDEDFTASR